jgi:hypothetical protein
VQLRNNSEAKAVNIPIRLKINNQQEAIGNLSLGARKRGTDTLTFSGMESGWKEAVVQITDYPVVFDDAFNFSFVVRSSLSVLAINNQAPNPYLNAVYRADPFFNLNNTPAGSTNYSALPTYQLIILNSVEEISEGLAQQLEGYVKNGGSLMIIPSLTGDLATLRSFLSRLGTDVPEQVVKAETKVTSINLQHPVFKDVFEDIPRNMDLPVARNYMAFSSRSRTSRQILLSFAGGRSLLSQYNLGKGKIYLSAVPLDEESGNLVKHAVFVPIMFQAAFLSLREGRLSYTLGRDQYLETNRIAVAANQTLKLKKQKFETIPEIQQTESTTRLFIADQIKEEGIYDLNKGDSLLGKYAFNNSRSESDLTYLEDNVLKSHFAPDNVELFEPGRESIQNAIKATDEGIQLWKLCIILALLSLAAEILLLRFYKTTEYKNT